MKSEYCGDLCKGEVVWVNQVKGRRARVIARGPRGDTVRGWVSLRSNHGIQLLVQLYHFDDPHAADAKAPEQQIDWQTASNEIASRWLTNPSKPLVPTSMAPKPTEDDILGKVQPLPTQLRRNAAEEPGKPVRQDSEASLFSCEASLFSDGSTSLNEALPESEYMKRPEGRFSIPEKWPRKLDSVPEWQVGAQSPDGPMPMHWSQGWLGEEQWGSDASDVEIDLDGLKEAAQRRRDSVPEDEFFDGLAHFLGPKYPTEVPLIKHTEEDIDMHRVGQMMGDLHVKRETVPDQSQGTHRDMEYVSDDFSPTRQEYNATL